MEKASFYQVEFLQEDVIVDMARYELWDLERMAREMATMMDDGFVVRAELVIEWE